MKPKNRDGTAPLEIGRCPVAKAASPPHPPTPAQILDPSLLWGLYDFVKSYVNDLDRHILENISRDLPFMVCALFNIFVNLSA